MQHITVLASNVSAKVRQEYMQYLHSTAFIDSMG
jgi:hypothetical protein